MTKLILATLMGLTVLSGCGTVPTGTFSNRVACSAAKDEAYVVSKYGSVGVASTLDQKDTAVICK